MITITLEITIWCQNVISRRIIIMQNFKSEFQYYIDQLEPGTSIFAWFYLILRLQLTYMITCNMPPLAMPYPAGLGSNIASDAWSCVYCHAATLNDCIVAPIHPIIVFISKLCSWMFEQNSIIGKICVRVGIWHELELRSATTPYIDQCCILAHSEQIAPPHPWSPAAENVGVWAQLPLWQTLHSHDNIAG